MTLVKKLFASFVAMLALVVLVSVGALTGTYQLNRELERAANVTARQQQLDGDMGLAASQMTSLERATVLAAILGDRSQSDQYRERFGQAQARLRNDLTTARRLAESAAAAARLDAFDRQASLVAQAHEELRGAMTNQQMDAALSIFSQKVQPPLEEIVRQAEGLIQERNRELSAAAETSGASAARVRAITIALMLLGLCAGGGVLWVVRNAGRSLRLLASRISESADHVANAASQVSVNSHSLAQGASQQGASLEETSASTEEVASITRKNAEHASEVAQLVQASDAGAAGVNQSLGRMVEQMKQIDASSGKIARIIKVIDEIAFQTNILALNAAVEAARAGEAGLGFAVVADEVRNLAQRCAQAARDTATLIEESIASARDGNTRLDQMAGAVVAMTGNSSRVRILVDEVNSGSQEQARGMDQIAKAILDIEQITMKTAAAAEESASAVTELNDYAGKLRTLVQDMHLMVGTS